METTRGVGLVGLFCNFCSFQCSFVVPPPAHFSLANRNFDSVLFTNSDIFPPFSSFLGCYQQLPLQGRILFIDINISFSLSLFLFIFLSFNQNQQI